MTGLTNAISIILRVMVGGGSTGGMRDERCTLGNKGMMKVGILFWSGMGAYDSFQLYSQEILDNKGVFSSMCVPFLPRCGRSS